MLSISLYAVESLFQWQLALSSLFEDLQEVRGLRAREHLVLSTTSRDVVLCTKAPRAIQALVKEEYDRNEA